MKGLLDVSITGFHGYYISVWGVYCAWKYGRSLTGILWFIKIRAKMGSLVCFQVFKETDAWFIAGDDDDNCFSWGRSCRRQQSVLVLTIYNLIKIFINRRDARLKRQCLLAGAGIGIRKGFPVRRLKQHHPWKWRGVPSPIGQFNL